MARQTKTMVRRISEDEIKWILSLNAKGAQGEINTLTGEIRNLEKEQKSLTDETNRLNKENDSLAAKMEKLREKGAENSAQFQQLSKRYQENQADLQLPGLHLQEMIHHITERIIRFRGGPLDKWIPAKCQPGIDGSIRLSFNRTRCKRLVAGFVT